jgi:ring-1,2-phenylacetyl-CoA epoxidase subunit PaaE
VAFAAGSGITPVVAIAADLLQHEPHSLFTLIYGNRSVARSMMLEELFALKDNHLDRFALHFLMSREHQDSALFNGRLDAEKVRALCERIPGLAQADEYFICGPGAMVDDVKEALAAQNGAAVVRIERFSTGTRAGATPSEAAPAVAHKILARIGITADGRRREFSMDERDGSVLEAAERAGLSLPFSCRAGICATCRTKVTAGSVSMMHNIALEPWEIEAGFVLCCQARPESATLELSYDEK